MGKDPTKAPTTGLMVKDLIDDWVMDLSDINKWPNFVVGYVKISFFAINYLFESSPLRYYPFAAVYGEKVIPHYRLEYQMLNL